jgi:peptide/nickel transport system permease protein
VAVPLGTTPNLHEVGGGPIGRYLLRRLLAYIPVLFGISIGVFLLMRLIPGDAVDIMLGQIRVDPQTQESLRRLFGIDRPLWEQYWLWISSVMVGDLGVSIRTGRPVLSEILSAAWPTTQLAVAAALIGSVIAIPAGIIAAIRQYSWTDTAVTGLGYIGISMPVFWLGTLLILMFSVRYSWLPAGGYADPFQDFWLAVQFTALPAITLGLVFAAFLMRIVRSSMLEVLRQDYMRTATAKGITPRLVLYRHALRNAAIPVLTVIGLQFGWLIGGSVVVEQVFIRPGIGRLLVNAVFQRDYPIVQGVALFLAIVFLTINLLVDILYAMVDPRIRYD